MVENLSAELSGPATSALAMRGVSVRVNGRNLVENVDWIVRRGERWVILGHNGSGKTTLLRVASTYLGPTRGDVDVLGHRRGRVDVRDLRARIGYVSQTLTASINRTTRVRDLVGMGRTGKLYLLQDHLGDDVLDEADDMLELVGCRRFGDRTLTALSAGELQRVLLARSLMAHPELLLLDEPSAGLDVGGRELLVSTLEQLAARADLPAVVFVTHHPEEVPSNFTHALLLREGRLTGSGPIDRTLTSQSLSECFGLPLILSRIDGRLYVRAHMRQQPGA